MQYDREMRTAAVSIFLFAIIAGGCAGPRSSSEAAWERGQCDQIIDEKMRKKCLERVETESGTQKTTTGAGSPRK